MTERAALDALLSERALLRNSITLARGLDWCAQQGQPLPGPEANVRAAGLSYAVKLLPSKTALQTTCQQWTQADFQITPGNILRVFPTV